MTNRVGATMRRCLRIFVLGCFILIGAPSVSADTIESASVDPTVQKHRDWTITIPLWVPGYQGQFAVGDIEVDGTTSGGPGFLERLFESELQLNFFFMGAFSYQHSRWRVHGDIFGGKFTDDVIFKLTDGTIASASLQPFIPRLHLDYRLVSHSWGDSGVQEVSGWVYAGVRHYNVKADVQVLQQQHELEAAWTDPIVGVRIPIDISRRWWFEVSGDVGGFSAGSDLSWTTYFAVTYRISALISATLAYNILSVDYEGEVSSQDFTWRSRVAGPGLGIRFNF